MDDHCTRTISVHVIIMDGIGGKSASHSRAPMDPVSKVQLHVEDGAIPLQTENTTQGQLGTSHLSGTSYLFASSEENGPHRVGYVGERTCSAIRSGVDSGRRGGNSSTVSKLAVCCCKLGSWSAGDADRVSKREEDEWRISSSPRTGVPAGLYRHTRTYYQELHLPFFAAGLVECTWIPDSGYHPGIHKPCHFRFDLLTGSYPWGELAARSHGRLEARENQPRHGTENATPSDPRRTPSRQLAAAIAVGPRVQANSIIRVSTSRQTAGAAHRDKPFGGVIECQVM